MLGKVWQWPADCGGACGSTTVQTGVDVSDRLPGLPPAPVCCFVLLISVVILQTRDTSDNWLCAPEQERPDGYRLRLRWKQNRKSSMLKPLSPTEGLQMNRRVYNGLCPVACLTAMHPNRMQSCDPQSASITGNTFATPEDNVSADPHPGLHSAGRGLHEISHSKWKWTGVQEPPTALPC
ncbi:unnamed protein product [Boreogadus saida]